MKGYLDFIRQTIAEGTTLKAIDHLNEFLHAAPDFIDALVLIKNRFVHLESSVRDGIISREVENIERNNIHRSLMQVVKDVEQLSFIEKERIQNSLPVGFLEDWMSKNTSKPKNTIKASLYNLVKKPLWLFFTIASSGILGAVVYYRAFAPVQIIKQETIKTVQLPAVPDPNLVLRLIIDNPNPNWKPKGYIQIKMGDYLGELLPFSNNETVLQLKNFTQKDRSKTVKPEFSDLKFPLTLVSQSAPDFSKTLEITVRAKISTKIIAGKIVYPDAQPAANIEIDIENGLAVAISDAEGRFQIVSPALTQETVKLTFRKNKSVVLSRQVGYNASVFNEFKIPH
jgi:hypothetical protein